MTKDQALSHIGKHVFNADQIRDPGPPRTTIPRGSAWTLIEYDGGDDGTFQYTTGAPARLPISMFFIEEDAWKFL